MTETTTRTVVMNSGPMSPDSSRRQQQPESCTFNNSTEMSTSDMTDEAAVLAKINPSSVPAQNTYRDPTSPTWVQTSSPSPPAPPPKTHNDTNYSVTPVTINSTSTSKPGVWSPGAPPPRIPSGYNSPQRDANFNVAPVWKPGMSGDQVDKKEFKPVKVELNDKSKTEKRMQDLPAPPPPAESFAWKPPPPPPKDETTHEYKNLSESNSLPNRAFSHRNYTNGPTPSGLPSTQSPTVTILQHNRGVEESPPRPPPPPSHYGGGLLYAPTLSSQQASDNPNVATNTQNQAPLTSPPYKPVTSQQHYNQPSVCPPEQVRSPPPPQEKQLSPPPPPPQPSPPLLPQGQYHASPTQQRLQQQIYHKANPQQVVTSQQERQPVEKWQLNPPQQPTPPKQYQANPSQQQGPPQQYQDSSSQQQRPPPLQSYQASPQQQERPPPPQQYQTSPQQQQRPPPPPPPQHYQASPQQQERPPPPQQYQASPQQQQRPPPPQQYQAFPQQQRPPPPQQYQAVSSQQQGPPPPQQYQAFPQQQQRPPPPQQYQVGPPQQQGPPPPQQYQASSYQQERPPLPQSWQSTQPQQEIPPPPPPPQQWQPDSSQQRPLPPPPPPTHQEPHHPISPPSQQQQQQRLPQPQTWQTSKQPLRVDVQSPYNAQPPHRKSIPSPTIPPRPSPPKVEMKSPPVKLNIASKDGWRPVEDMAKIADTNVFVLTDPDHHVKASIKTHDIEGSTVLKDKVIYDEPNFQVISDPQQLPPGAVYQTKTVEGDLVHTDTYYPVKVPGTVETGRRMVRQTATYDGIGPVDNESGMPIGLRTGVKEENRHDWYKEMYKSIHRQEKKDDDNPYTPTYIFPEDSDDKKKKDIFSYRPTYEFSDVSKRKTETEKERELSPTRKAAVGSGQQWTVPSARNTIERYQQQPRSITEYEPGKSSLAAKDKSVTGHMYNPPAEPIKSSTTYKTLPANYKRSVEPVQHQQQQQQQQLSPQHRQLSPHHQQGSPVHYHHSPPPVSHDLYKEVQKGGDIPVHGLVKKPGEEEEEDVNGLLDKASLTLEPYSQEWEMQFSDNTFYTRHYIYPHYRERYRKAGDLNMTENTDPLGSDNPERVGNKKFSFMKAEMSVYAESVAMRNEPTRPRDAVSQIEPLSDRFSFMKACMQELEETARSEREYTEQSLDCRLQTRNRPENQQTDTVVMAAGAMYNEQSYVDDDVYSDTSEEIQQIWERKCDLDLKDDQTGSATIPLKCQEKEVVKSEVKINSFSEKQNGKKSGLELEVVSELQQKLDEMKRRREKKDSKKLDEIGPSNNFTTSPKTLGVFRNPKPIMGGSPMYNSSHQPRPNTYGMEEPHHMAASMQDDEHSRSATDVRNGYERQDVTHPYPEYKFSDSQMSDGRYQNGNFGDATNYRKVEPKGPRRSREQRRSRDDFYIEPYSERPSAPNYIPSKRRAMSHDDISRYGRGVIKSPAFDQKSYHDYAERIYHASRRSRRYLELQEFHQKIDSVLEMMHQKKTKRFMQKYLPSDESIMKFDVALKYYEELEEASQYGDPLLDPRRVDKVRWKREKDAGLAFRERDTDELYRHWYELEHGMKSETNIDRPFRRVSRRGSEASDIQLRYFHVPELHRYYSHLDDLARTGRGTKRPISDFFHAGQVSSLLHFYEDIDTHMEERMQFKLARMHPDVHKQDAQVKYIHDRYEEMDMYARSGYDTMRSHNLPKVPLVDPDYFKQVDYTPLSQSKPKVLLVDESTIRRTPYSDYIEKAKKSSASSKQQSAKHTDQCDTINKDINMRNIDWSRERETEKPKPISPASREDRDYNRERSRSLGRPQDLNTRPMSGTSSEGRWSTNDLTSSDRDRYKSSYKTGDRDVVDKVVSSPLRQSGPDLFPQDRLGSPFHRYQRDRQEKSDHLKKGDNGKEKYDKVVSEIPLKVNKFGKGQPPPHDYHRGATDEKKQDAGLPGLKHRNDDLRDHRNSMRKNDMEDVDRYRGRILSPSRQEHIRQPHVSRGQAYSPVKLGSDQGSYRGLGRNHKSQDNEHREPKTSLSRTFSPSTAESSRKYYKEPSGSSREALYNNKQHDSLKRESVKVEPYGKRDFKLTKPETGRYESIQHERQREPHSSQESRLAAAKSEPRYFGIRQELDREPYIAEGRSYVDQNNKDNFGRTEPSMQQNRGFDLGKREPEWGHDSRMHERGKEAYSGQGRVLSPNESASDRGSYEAGRELYVKKGRGFSPTKYEQDRVYLGEREPEGGHNSRMHEREKKPYSGQGRVFSPNDSASDRGSYKAGRESYVKKGRGFSPTKYEPDRRYFGEREPEWGHDSRMQERGKKVFSGQGRVFSPDESVSDRGSYESGREPYVSQGRSLSPTKYEPDRGYRRHEPVKESIKGPSKHDQNKGYYAGTAEPERESQRQDYYRESSYDNRAPERAEELRNHPFEQAEQKSRDLYDGGQRYVPPTEEASVRLYRDSLYEKEVDPFNPKSRGYSPTKYDQGKESYGKFDAHPSSYYRQAPKLSEHDRVPPRQDIEREPIEREPSHVGYRNTGITHSPVRQPQQGKHQNGSTGLTYSSSQIPVGQDPELSREKAAVKKEQTPYREEPDLYSKRDERSKFRQKEMPSYESRLFTPPGLEQQLGQKPKEFDHPFYRVPVSKESAETKPKRPVSDSFTKVPFSPESKQQRPLSDSFTSSRIEFPLSHKPPPSEYRRREFDGVRNEYIQTTVPKMCTQSTQTEEQEMYFPPAKVKTPVIAKYSASSPKTENVPYAGHISPMIGKVQTKQEVTPISPSEKSAQSTSDLLKREFPSKPVTAPSKVPTCGAAGKPAVHESHKVGGDKDAVMKEKASVPTYKFGYKSLEKNLDKYPPLLDTGPEKYGFDGYETYAEYKKKHFLGEGETGFEPQYSGVTSSEYSGPDSASKNNSTKQLPSINNDRFVTITGVTKDGKPVSLKGRNISSQTDLKDKLDEPVQKDVQPQTQSSSVQPKVQTISVPRKVKKHGNLEFEIYLSPKDLVDCVSPIIIEGDEESLPSSDDIETKQKSVQELKRHFSDMESKKMKPGSASSQDASEHSVPSSESGQKVPLEKTSNKSGSEPCRTTLLKAETYHAVSTDAKVKEPFSGPHSSGPAPQGAANPEGNVGKLVTISKRPPGRSASADAITQKDLQQFGELHKWDDSQKLDEIPDKLEANSKQKDDKTSVVSPASTSVETDHSRSSSRDFNAKPKPYTPVSDTENKAVEGPPLKSGQGRDFNPKPRPYKSIFEEPQHIQSSSKRDHTAVEKSSGNIVKRGNNVDILILDQNRQSEDASVIDTLSSIENLNISQQDIDKAFADPQASVSVLKDKFEDMSVDANLRAKQLAYTTGSVSTPELRPTDQAHKPTPSSSSSHQQPFSYTNLAAPVASVKDVRKQGDRGGLSDREDSYSSLARHNSCPYIDNNKENVGIGPPDEVMDEIREKVRNKENREEWKSESALSSSSLPLNPGQTYMWLDRLADEMEHTKTQKKKSASYSSLSSAKKSERSAAERVRAKAKHKNKSRSYKPASSMTAIDQVNGKQNVKAPASNRYSASDLYNYRSPAGPVSPSSNRDKQRIIEDEKRRKKEAEKDQENWRRHSDYSPLKSPIITNERFEDPAEIARRKELQLRRKAQELKANAKAIYPFNPQNAKELPFKKGDMIKLIRQIDKNWYEGEHHGRVGIFPVSYVEIMSPEPVKSPIQQPQVDVSTEGKARAKYNFSGETNMELSFKKGDQITLIRRVDNNWAEGRLGNRRGIFPVSYIEVTKEPVSPAQKSPSSQPQQRQKQQHSPVKQKPKEQIYQQQRSQPVQSSPSVSHQYYQQRDMPPPPPTPPVQEHFRAIYPYAPQNEDELELIEGDVVVVMEKCDDGWFVGTSTRTGHFGTFPGNYVEKM